MVKVLALPRRAALEAFDNRHYGISSKEVYEIALAIYRARTKMPEASLKDALYIQQLGLVLPVKFEGGSLEEDVALMREIVHVGPFAQGPFLNDIATTAVAIVSAANAK